MKKFIVTYHAPQSALEQMAQMSQEEQTKGMEPWMQWAQKCGDKLVDLGSPLANSVRLSPNGANRASQKEICGYSIIQANSLDEAQTLLQGHPHFMGNEACSIEVHETMPLPGM